MTPRCRCFIVTFFAIIPASVAAAINAHFLIWRTFKAELTFVIVVSIPFCYLITLFSYVKVYQIILRHHQQVQGNQSSQNLEQPAINLAKYVFSGCSVYHSKLSAYNGFHSFAYKHSNSALGGTICWVLQVFFHFLSRSFSSSRLSLENEWHPRFGCCFVQITECRIEVLAYIKKKCNST